MTRMRLLTLTVLSAILLAGSSLVVANAPAAESGSDSLQRGGGGGMYVKK